MNLFFIKSKKAILPEVKAYSDYFICRGWVCSILSSTEMYKVKSESGVAWYFMGVNIIRPHNKFVVHEYTSLSVGHFPRFKNLIKRFINCKPDLRVFQSKDVEKEMNFKDDVPSFYRDMAISKSYCSCNLVEKEFDFVYCGAINKDRKLDKILNRFLENKTKNIMVIGDVPSSYLERYGDAPNITIVGRVDYDDVPFLLRKAKVGVNVLDDKYPYNIQTSTKILEYLACGLGVYTTKNDWCIKYEQEHNVVFSYFEVNDFDVNVECTFQQEVDINTWEKEIYASKIESYLKGAVNG